MAYCIFIVWILSFAHTDSFAGLQGTILLPLPANLFFLPCYQIPFVFPRLAHDGQAGTATASFLCSFSLFSLFTLHLDRKSVSGVNSPGGLHFPGSLHLRCSYWNLLGTQVGKREREKPCCYFHHCLQGQFGGRDQIVRKESRDSLGDHQNQLSHFFGVFPSKQLKSQSIFVELGNMIVWPSAQVFCMQPTHRPALVLYLPYLSCKNVKLSPSEQSIDLCKAFVAHPSADKTPRPASHEIKPLQPTSGMEEKMSCLLIFLSSEAQGSFVSKLHLCILGDGVSCISSCIRLNWREGYTLHTQA